MICGAISVIYVYDPGANTLKDDMAMPSETTEII
jgi:hypothetical protein